MSPDERHILSRAPLTLTLVSRNMHLIAVARKLERDGFVKLEPIEGKGFGDPSALRIWITRAGAEAYARGNAA